MKSGIQYIILFVSYQATFSCHDKIAKTENAIQSQSDSTNFFPVNDYLIQQIKYADSTSVNMYKISVDDSGKKDSSVLSKEEFNRLAKNFIADDISEKMLRKNYNQNNFLDQTTSDYTFIYTTLDTNITVQIITVLVDANTQQVTRIFINKEKNYQDSSVTEKLGWKNNTSFFIHRIREYAGKKKTQQNTIVFGKIL